MKVLLVDPPQKVGYLVRVTAVSQGLAMIASCLEAEGHEVRVADFVGMRGGWPDLERLLRDFQPDAVGITCTHTPFFYSAMQVAALVRDVVPSALIVGGGGQFMALAAEALGTGNVDVVVFGEGEATMVELLRDPASRTAAGLGYLQEGRLVQTAARPFLTCLDDLPAPAWRHFPMRQHGLTALGGRRSTVLTVGRGCLNRCAFCSEGSFWEGAWHGFSGERAAEEVRRLYLDHGKSVFYLGDNDFLVSPQRVVDFCAALGRMRLPVHLWVQTTVRHACQHPDLLRLLREAGAYQAMLGLESVNPAILRRYAKPQNLELMERAIANVKAAGLAVMGCWMWGDWEDTEESLRAGVDWVLDRCDFLAPSVTMPYPGTPYHEACRAAGRIEVEDLEKYGKFYFVMGTRTMSREECQERYDEVVFSRRWFLHNLRTWLTNPHAPARWYARTLVLTEMLYSLNARLSRRLSFREHCLRTRGFELPWRPTLSGTPRPAGPPAPSGSAPAGRSL